MDQIPRTFAAATSALETKRLIHHLGTNSPPSSNNIWKISREFEETLQAYEQPATRQIDEEHNTQESNYLNLTEHQGKKGFDMAQQQRETVSIGFDPNHNSQNRRSLERPERSAPTHTWEAQTGVAQTTNGTTTNYRSTLDDTKPQGNPTVTEFYAPHQQDEEGMYTLAPGLDEAGDAEGATTHSNWDQQEFERPRAVPYDHRETRLVVKEDIDFFMALLGGQEPPPATEETQHFIQEETEAKRRSQEVIEREVSERKEDELVTTQTDLEFWNSLMRAS